MFSRIQSILFSRQKTIGQFIRFVVVGVINTVVDFSVYIGLTRSFLFWQKHIIVAAVISFCCAVATSFLLNNFWTFRNTVFVWDSRCVKFFIVALGGLLWSVLLLHILTSAGMYDILAKIVIIFIVLFWNFTLQKRWTFKA